MSRERRGHTRVPFEIDSVVHYKGDEMIGTVLNMSLHGMFVDIKERLPRDSMVDVDIHLSGKKASRSLTFTSRVVRSDDTGTAIKVMDLDLDTCISLRDLMMERSGAENCDILMQEFYRIVNNCED